MMKAVGHTDMTNIKLPLQNIPPESILSPSPKPGDIYTKAGGYWWVVAVTPQGHAIVMSFDVCGVATGCQNYGGHYFRDRDHRRIGFAAIPIIEPTWY